MPDPNQLSPDPGQDVLRVDGSQLADLEQRFGLGAAEQVADVGGTAVDGSGVTQVEQSSGASTDQDGMIRYPEELLGAIPEGAPKPEPYDGMPPEVPASDSAKSGLVRVGGTDQNPRYATRVEAQQFREQGAVAAADAATDFFAAKPRS